jgi:hypothetical protein
MKPMFISFCVKKIIPVNLLVLGLFFSQFLYANSERVWPILTFTCDTEKNEVKLKNEVKWGAAGKNFPFSVEQGTYNPWNLVAFKDRGGVRMSREKSQLNLSCQLGKAEYKFTIKPKIFNPNFNAKCGNRLSVTVSIYKNQVLLVEDKPMETFCNGNAPVLRGIKIKGDKGKVQFFEVPRSRFY